MTDFVLNSKAVLRLNFCTSISATSPSRKPSKIILTHNLTKLEKEALHNIISALQSNSENAQLGFYYMNNDDGETYIKGNKAGLEWFAGEILNASLRIEEIEKGKVEKLYVNINKDWIENEIALLFIHPVINFKRKEATKTSYGWKEELKKYGCVLLTLAVIISAIIGIVTIIGYF